MQTYLCASINKNKEHRTEKEVFVFRLFCDI